MPCGGWDGPCHVAVGMGHAVWRLGGPCRVAVGMGHAVRRCRVTVGIGHAVQRQANSEACPACSADACFA
eukprot:203729-Chlamydomonas_euryale.AAC.1